MGNRGVITTKENLENNGIGIYVHWNGGYSSINAFLTYCKLQGYRSPETDNYGWARLCQVIGNFFGGSTSLGIDTVNNLDCDNGDNGVYLIENWEIVGRRYYSGAEETDYDLEEFLLALDNLMPLSDQLGKEKIHKYIISKEEL